MDWKGCGRREVRGIARPPVPGSVVKARSAIVQAQSAEVSGQRFPDNRCSFDLARVLAQTSALAAPRTTAVTTAPI